VADQGRAAAVLIGVAAHDLRTPLSAMSGWLQILRSSAELPAATRDRAFKGLQMAMAQQIALADGLAMMAALQTGELAPETRVVNLQALAGAAAASLQDEAATRLVALRMLEASAVGPTATVESDAGLIAALIRHLLGAALKFAAKNSDLSMAALAGEGGAGVIRIEIARSLLPGDGIANLLTYVRGVAGDKPSGGGAAFSLSLVQHIAAVLGGSVQAGVGAIPEQVVLSVALPARPPQA
jgi:signal transduction histidine kinase